MYRAHHAELSEAARLDMKLNEGNPAAQLDAMRKSVAARPCLSSPAGDAAAQDMATISAGRTDSGNDDAGLKAKIAALEAKNRATEARAAKLEAAAKASPPKRSGMAALGGGGGGGGGDGGRGRGSCASCSDGHHISDCTTTTFVPGHDGTEVKYFQCWTCNKFGHKKDNCPASTAHPNGLAPTAEGGKAR